MPLFSLHKGGHSKLSLVWYILFLSVLLLPSGVDYENIMVAIGCETCFERYLVGLCEALNQCVHIYKWEYNEKKIFSWYISQCFDFYQLLKYVLKWKWRFHSRHKSLIVMKTFRYLFGNICGVCKADICVQNGDIFIFLLPISYLKNIKSGTIYVRIANFQRHCFPCINVDIQNWAKYDIFCFCLYFYCPLVLTIKTL